MLEKPVYLFTIQMYELSALLALHVIALLVAAAVFRTNVFIAGRRFFINNVFIYQTVSR